MSSAQQIWEATLAWYKADSTFVRRAIMRSLYLLRLEAARGHRSNWRGALGAGRRLIGALFSRQVALSEDATVWLVTEGSAPSLLSTSAALADLTVRMGLSTLLIAGNKDVRHDTAGTTDVPAVCVDNLPYRPSTGRRLVSARGAAVGAFSALRDLSPRLSIASTLQLMCEAGVAAVTRDGIRELICSSPPSLVLAPSEYFPVGVGVSEAVTQAGIPWVTLQHGAVNRTYAPTIASEYWVWGAESARALRTLDLRSKARTRVVGSVRLEVCGRSDKRAVTGEHQSSGVNKVVALFSQSHGLEFETWVHEELAGELARLLDRMPSVGLIVKSHPNERASIYGVHLRRIPRTTILEGCDASVADIAASCVCCVALDSTALLESMLAGALAVSVNVGVGSMVVQPVAAFAVQPSLLGNFLESVLKDEDEMKAALAHQTTILPSLLNHVGRVASVHASAVQQLVGATSQTNREVSGGDDRGALRSR